MNSLQYFTYDKAYYKTITTLNQQTSYQTFEGTLIASSCKLEAQGHASTSNNVYSCLATGP